MTIFIFLTAFSSFPRSHLPISFHDLLFPNFFLLFLQNRSLRYTVKLLPDTFPFIYFLLNSHAIKYLHFGFTRFFPPHKSQPRFENMLIEWADEFMAFIFLTSALHVCTQPPQDIFCYFLRTYITFS